MHTLPYLQRGNTLELATEVWILLHGRGATAHDILTLGSLLATDSACLIAPQAMNNTWYPYSFLAPLAHNEPWLSSAVEMVQSCIEEMKRYLPVESIFLAGFSQGACLCLESAARNPAPYGGIVAFTGGLVGKEVQHEIYTGSFEGCKVFISNSDRDPHVPLERSLETATVLEKMDASVRHVTYPGMPHTVTQEALKAAKQWLS